MKNNLAVFQLLKYFIIVKGYRQMVVKGVNNDDTWLIGENNQFPLIHISSEPANSSIYEKQLQLIHTVKDAILSRLNIKGNVLDIRTSKGDVVRQLNNIITCDLENELPIEVANYFPNLKDYIYKVDNDLDEISKITREIESRQREIKKAIKKQIKYPVVTFALIGICMLMYGLIFSYSFLTKHDLIATGIAFGASYKILVYANFEFWRLLLTGFIHYDILHLLINCMALFNIGVIIEPMLGKMKYLLIVLASIIMGSLFALIGSNNGVTIGISGGIYGLLGSLITLSFLNGTIKIPVIRNSFMRIILVNIFINFLPNVSILGHLGGAITGVFLTLVLEKLNRNKALRINVIIASVLLIISLVFFMIKDNNIYPLYLKTDEEVLEIYQDLGLKNYSMHLKTKLIEIYKGVIE